MTIRDIIIRYSKELEEISSTPRLDVETLLQKVLNVDRLYILLNLERSLSEEEENLFNKGITFWKDPSKVGTYTGDNSIE